MAPHGARMKPHLYLVDSRRFDIDTAFAEQFQILDEDLAMPDGPRSRPSGRALLHGLAGKAASIAIAVAWIVITAYAVSLWVVR